MQIQPIHQTIGQLLTGRMFIIPSYQRAYSWGSKQRLDLFQDIQKVANAGADASHFMATFVGLRTEKVLIAADEFVKLDIVDGQQRITTIVILLKAIEIALVDGDAESQKLALDIKSLLIKGDKVNLLLLQTNHDLSHVFANFLREGTYPELENIKIAADKNLYNAIIECTDFVSNWVLEGRNLIDLVSLIRNRLSTIFHEIEDEGLVYTVFEVLNSRGLDVTWFDKLKSLLMAIVFEHGDKGGRAATLKELHNLWGEIYQTIGLRQNLNQETVRFAGTLKATAQPNRPLGEESAVAELILQCGKSSKKVLATTRWCLQVAKAEDKILSNNRLRAVTRIVQARLVAIAVILRNFPKSVEEEVLRKWENVTFRIYGCSNKDARSAVGEYVRLAWQIHNNELSREEILENLDIIGKEAPVKEAVMGLWNTDCYNGWREELRYLLYRYEEFLAKKMGQQINESQWNKIWQDEPSNSIEHIKPQSSNLSYVHRLGNLTVLPPGVNSRLQAKDPRLKAETYSSCGLLDAVDVGKQVKKSKWGLSMVERRENKILKWAMNEWRD